MPKDNVQNEAGTIAEKPSMEGQGHNEALEPKASETSESISSEDIQNIIELLNVADTENGGNGGIKDVPKQLHGSLKYIIGKLMGIRDAFEDPLFKESLEDMAEQREEGKTPSLLVAVLRNVPFQTIQEMADSEDYSGYQDSVQAQVEKSKADEEADKKLYANFDTSKKNIENYCKKNGCTPEEKQEIYDVINTLMKIFADGLISEKEVGDIRKIAIYDTDIEKYKSMIPKEPVRESLPDTSSMTSMMEEKPTNYAPNNKPRNSIETVEPMITTPEYMKKRGRFGKGM